MPAMAIDINVCFNCPADVNVGPAPTALPRTLRGFRPRVSRSARPASARRRSAAIRYDTNVDDRRWFHKIVELEGSGAEALAVDAELSHLVAENSLGRMQEFGGFGAIASRRLERVLNERALVRIDGVGQ